jgi:tetratricopeptide (TPR) repeat protein
MSGHSRWFCRSHSSTICWLAVFICLAGNIAIGQESTKKQPSPQAVKARAYANESKWDHALSAADGILENDPENANARVTRGIALNGQGKYDEAMEEFDVVTELKGRTPEMLANRADAFAHQSYSYYRKGDYLEAVNSAYYATLEQGDHSLAHNNRSNAYIAREEYDKAIRSANRALKSDDTFAAAYSNRGFAYAKKGNTKKAISNLNKAIKLDATMAVAFQRRGAAYTIMGQLNEAGADLNKALQMQPDLIDALCDRAYLYGLSRNMKAAMADLDKAIKLQPDSLRANLVRGQALLEQNQFNSAIENFDRVLILHDEHAGAYCFRAYAQQGKKEFETAVADFTKAIELEPEFEMAWKGRSRAYKDLGRRDESKADRAMAKKLSSPAKDAEPASEPQRFSVTSATVAPGKLQDALQAASRIDKLVESNYGKHGISPNPKTTDAQFVRRVYLDITGTIPTYKQTRRFLESKDDDKRIQLIDELLNSDGYASHSFNYWADVLRYTDRLNDLVSGEPYRQWIKQSLAENKPWDQLVSELISAEGLIWDNPATGYMQRDANMPLANMNNTVRIFLGTRIGCAQCHDHPFDRWTQKEFYQMAAFTYGTKTHTGGSDTRFWADNPNDRLQEEYEEIVQEEEERRSNSYRFKRLIRTNMQIVNDLNKKEIHLPKDYAYDNAKPNQVIPPKTLFGQPAQIQSDQAPRQAFAEWLTSKDNPRFAVTIANRLWQRAFGIGQIEPIDDMVDGTIAENPDLMAFLEAEMKRNDFDMKQFMRMIFNSQTYQRQVGTEQIHAGEPYHFPGPLLRRMTAEQLWDSFLTLAVVDPDEHRERPASVRTDVIGVSLDTVSAPDLLQAVHDGRQVNSGRYRRERKYRYKGTLLARSSELPSPVPANHFLRMFGQSDRELISASSTTGSVPQVLFMFNGPISHMILEQNSAMYNNVKRTRSVSRGTKVVFRTILSRDPDKEEAALAASEIKQNGISGYGNVIWALVNTREFLFVQ